MFRKKENPSNLRTSEKQYQTFPEDLCIHRCVHMLSVFCCIHSSAEVIENVNTGEVEEGGRNNSVKSTKSSGTQEHTHAAEM